MTSIEFLKRNRDRNNIYKIIVLAKGVSEGELYDFSAEIEQNLSIGVINTDRDIKHAVLDACLQGSGENSVTVTEILKFAIADILEDRDKVLYIDGDTITQSDL